MKIPAPHFLLGTFGLVLTVLGGLSSLPAQELGVSVERAIGSEGVGQGEFIQPSSVSVDPAGGLYVADTGNHRIEWFDPDGLFIMQMGGFGFETRQLNQPMAVDATGLNVYVADTLNRRVLRLDRRLNALGTIKDPDDTPFGFIRSVAVSGMGDLYLIDAENDEVIKLNTSQRVELRFGGFRHGDGRLRKPSGIVLDRHGRVYVADTGNNRIAVYDPYGAFIRALGTGALNQPEGVDVDELGRVFVADTGNNRIVIFSEEGSVLLTFGSKGNGPGSFEAPRAIAARPDGVLFVADTGNNRVQRLRLHE